LVADTPQNEALRLLNEVVQDMLNPPFDIKTNLRKCQHSCEILGWKLQRDWFHQEINGYYPDSSPPNYRIISGQTKWVPSGSLYENVRWNSEVMVDNVDSEIYDIQADELEVRADIDWLQYSAKFGYEENLGSTKKVRSPSGKFSITMERKRIFPAANFRYSLTQIEKQAFDFVSKAYVQVRFGDVIGGIWQKYRQEVDVKMAGLNLTGHLTTIEKGLLSVNSEDWRTSAFECRNLINDLANYLWRDERIRYEHLPGNTIEGTLDVSQGKFGNRIAAYIHQKGISGTRGRFIRVEAERLSSSIFALIPFQSEAHEPISLQDAQSIAIATYILVGEVIRRTDLEPILVYGQPTIADLHK